MPKVTIGLNALDQSTWIEHDVQSLSVLLLETFGDRFPSTGKIFHQTISQQTDVTPKPGDDTSVGFMLSLPGPFWVVVYPAGAGAGAPEGTPTPLGGIAMQNAGLLIAALTISWLIKPEGKISGGFNFRQITGSPNNKLGDRQNTARVLGRIPDIYGLVRSVPDLIQEVYTTYVGHRETEIALMCVGRGSYTITDVRDGDMLVGQIDGMSVVQYGSFTYPGQGIPPESVIGTMIDDPVFTVRNIEAVNGQPVLAPNAKTFIGEYAVDVGSDRFWEGTLFKYLGGGVGTITVGGSPDEVRDRVRVGDALEIVYPVDRTNVGAGLDASDPPNPLRVNGKSSNPNISFANETNFMRFFQGGTGALPDLTSNSTNFVTVTDITTLEPNFFNRAVLTVSVPAALQAQWALINTFTASTIFPGFLENNGCLITALGTEWVGPFFVESPIPTTSEQLIVCNFVAQEGLFADDGKSFKPFVIRMEVEITPTTSSGTPTADPVQTETSSIIGTATSRNTRALTMKIVPFTKSNFFKIRARRVTRTPWKEDSPSQYRVTAASGPSPGVKSALALTGSRIKNNPGSADPNQVDVFGAFINSSYLPFYGQVKDDVRWTHCFTLTTVDFSTQEVGDIATFSLGDITTLHVRTIATEGATSNKSRKLNCLAHRLLPTIQGSPAAFVGPRIQDNKTENVLVNILNDKFIGATAIGDIDMEGLRSTYQAVRAYFGGPDSDGFGGDEAGQFNYTFDDEKSTLEEMLNVVGSANFSVIFRTGKRVSARADVATPTAAMLVNHRNKLPGSETRTIRFGTEANYDGIRVDYTDTSLNDPTNNAVKTYTIPPGDVASKPRTLQAPGLRTKKHAAWYAWREFNKLLYTNTLVEFQACEEAIRLNLQDRFLLSDGTRSSAPVQEGEVLSISGATIQTSQPVDISGGAYTIFLQHTNDTVESIAVASSPSAHSLTLGSAPSVTLVTDGNAGVRTMYLLVKNSYTPPTAFLVSDRSNTGKGTYSITAGNYSHAFYWNDGLMIWLPFTELVGLAMHRDWGPYELATVSFGTTITDTFRGEVYEGGANAYIQITTSNVFASESYTKSAWVLRITASTLQTNSILSSVESNDEEFRYTSINQLQGIHNGTAYVTFIAPNTVGDWHMCSMSYDAVTQIMKLYYDGELVHQASSVPGRPIGNLRIFGNFVGVNSLRGRADDLRYWMRVLDDSEIRELFQKTRLP